MRRPPRVSLTFSRDGVTVYARLDRAVHALLLGWGDLESMATERGRVIATPERGVNPDAAEAASSLLTPRELQVAQMLADGYTVPDIGRRLGISHRTADVHKCNLQRKLGIHNRAQLVRWAIRNGIVSADAPMPATGGSGDA